MPLPPERPELRRVEGGALHGAVPPGLIRLGVGVVERHACRLGERLRQAVHGRIRLGVRNVVRLARGAVQGQEDEGARAVGDVAVRAQLPAGALEHDGPPAAALLANWAWARESPAVIAGPNMCPGLAMTESTLLSAAKHAHRFSAALLETG